MRTRLFPFLLLAPLAMAQAPAKATVKAAPNADADTARQSLIQVLDAVNNGWFGQPYQGITSVQMDGVLGISVSGATVNQKVDQLSQGQVKASSKGGQVNLRMKGTYFANGDFKTDVAGDFGTLLYTRRGSKGFLYSKEQNAYTTRVDLPPSDAPNTYLAWFRQTLNDIKAVYVDAPTFKPSLAGDGAVQRLVFEAPTKAWDPRKKEQGLAQTLGFWKRGRLEVSVDKATRLPQRLEFRNDEQGIQTRMDFSYGAGGKLQAVNIANSSRGFDGPGWMRVGYGGDGLMSQVAGELSGPDRKVSFAMDLGWSKTRKVDEIAAMPPAGTTKKGREELETQLLVGLAGQIFELQRAGFDLRSVAVAVK